MAIDEKNLLAVMLKYREREHGTVTSLIDWFVGIINACPKVNDWIPCSERLPETFEDTKSSDVVLVCGYNKESDYYWQAMGFYVNTESLKRWFFAECKNTDNPIDWIDIVAWMPLPEPYKPE